MSGAISECHQPLVSPLWPQSRAVKIRIGTFFYDLTYLCGFQVVRIFDGH